MRTISPNVRQGFDPLLLDVLEWSPLDEDERDPALREALHDAIDELPAAQRDVINALFWEGLSRREAARRYGMSRATVAKLLEQALGAISAVLHPSNRAQ